MTNQERLSACKRQFLYDSFLDDNHLLLVRLHENSAFMREIRSVSENTAEELLFGIKTSSDLNNEAKFKAYKDAFCDQFFQSLKFRDYPDYKEIYQNVTHFGRAGKSATISVFYAMVYLDILDETKVPSDLNETKETIPANR